MKNNNLGIFKKYGNVLVYTSSVLEMLFFPSLENLLGVLILTYGWILLSKIALTERNMIGYPVSFLCVFGWSIFHFILPIPLTLLELKPISYNMDVPILTFSHQFLLVNVVVLSYKFYTIIYRRGNIIRNILAKTSFYKTLSIGQVWILALVALSSAYYIYFVFGVWQSDVSERNIFTYLSAAFTPFIWLPLVLLFPQFTNLKINKINTIYVIIYAVLVGLIAIGSNVRTLLFGGLMLLVIMFSVAGLYGLINVKNWVRPQKLFILFCLAYIVTGPLNDLGYVMVYVRKYKYSLSPDEFLKKSLEVYQNDELVKKLREIDITGVGKVATVVRKWNEEYLNNAVLNRFSNLKISDACLYHAQNIGYQNARMQENFWLQIQAFTPNILLGVFGISEESKLETSSYSLTDYLYSLSIGSRYVRGSFIIGSIPGLGMAIFGYWYLVIVIPFFILIFSYFDSLVRIENGRLKFSFMYFSLLLLIVNLFNDRHVYTFEVRYVCRTFFEAVITYLLIIEVVKLIERYLKIF